MADRAGLRLRALHFGSALVLGLFLLAHLTNHVAGLQGQQTHVAYMAAARAIYRHWLVEPILLGLFAWQVATGLAMVIRGWKARRGRVAWLQALSGLYLAFFLVNHVGAVLAGRFLFGLDTDFRFAAAGFHVAPWQWFFAPYYFLAVFCLFAHAGCALYWRLGPGRDGARVAALGGFLAIGVLLATPIVLSMAGAFYPVDIPSAYRAPLGG